MWAAGRSSAGSVSEVGAPLGFAEAPGFGRGLRTWPGVDGRSTIAGFADAGGAAEEDAGGVSCVTVATDTTGSGAALESAGAATLVTARRRS